MAIYSKAPIGFTKGLYYVMYRRVLPLYVYVVNRFFELLCENKGFINKFNALFPLFSIIQF